MVIAIPLADSPLARNFYDIFRIEKFELLELVKGKRIKFVAYQNLHRYDLNFIADMLSADPDCILFSRRLASASLLEVRKRTGLFGYSIDTDTLFRLKRACFLSDNLALRTIADSLSDAIYFEYSMNQRGTMGLSNFGAGNFSANIYKNQGKDFFIEMASSAMSFEFVQGLNLHHFPFDTEGYSEINACNILNGIYNGVQAENHNIKESEVGMLLADVFAISNDMSVLELDDVLSEHGRKRVHDIISRFSSLTPEERKNELYVLNKELRQIEKRGGKLSKMNITGLISTAAGIVMAHQGVPGGAYVALLPWVIKSLSLSSGLLGHHENQILERLPELTRGASGNTLLIRKIRNDLN